MTPMRERLARAIDLCAVAAGVHGKALTSQEAADACLRELETPSEGMVEAGLGVFMRGGNIAATYTAMNQAAREGK